MRFFLLFLLLTSTAFADTTDDRVNYDYRKYYCSECNQNKDKVYGDAVYKNTENYRKRERYYRMHKPYYNVDKEIKNESIRKTNIKVQNRN